jgi:hypothetical protein
MNSQKVKALKVTAGMLAVCTLAALTVHFVFTYVPLQVIGYVGAVVFVGFMLNILYQINLGRIKYEDQLKETVKSFKE